LKVKVGQVVTVTNADNTDHTATADDGSFDTGRFSDGTRTIKLSRPGRLAYHCSIHDYMRGVIQVGP
jgi:plastocyanin